jgi:enediyne biosynthesis protein E3
MTSQSVHLPGLLRRPLMLSPGKLSLATGWLKQADPDVRPALSAVIGSFAAGYNHVLDPAAAPGPTTFPTELAGFAVEGAAMSCTLLDLLTFSRGPRLAGLWDEYGAQYAHLIHVGAGWAYARLHRRPWSRMTAWQPLLRWLAFDGWGFHQAFFWPQKTFEQRVGAKTPRSDVDAIRDQGAGRALWFYAVADPARIASVIGTFDPARRPDLWAGVGLAACYTGARGPEQISKLAAAAGPHRHELGQGAAWAAKARVLSGAVPPSCAAAIEVLAGVSPETAAEWTDECFVAVGAGATDTAAAYQQWRARTREAWSRHNGGALL